MKFGPLALAFENILYPALLFFLTPHIINDVGMRDFGSWAYLGSITAAASVLSFGSMIASIKWLTESCYDNIKYPCAIRSVYALFFGQALLMGFVLAVLLNFFVNNNGNQNQYRILLSSGVVIILAEQVDIATISLVRAAQNFTTTLKYDVVIRFFQAISMYFSAKYLGFEWMLILFSGTSIFRCLIKFLATKKMRPSGFELIGRVNLYPLIRYARYGWIQGVLGGTVLFADRIIVGNVLGSSSVTSLAVLSIVPQQVHAVAVASISYIFPKILKRRADGDTTWISERRTVLILTAKIGIVLAAFFLLFCFFSGWLIKLWLKGLPIEGAWWLINILMAGYILQIINAPSYYIIDAFGFSKINTYVMAFSGVIALPAMWYMVNLHGIAGAAFAKIIYGVLCLLMVAYVGKKNI
ncbi:hypothetical protein [Sphaerotilus sp.]|uniref:lipopolysaccharide biosynthesis protein n=1 Tax=Sphaerotilus sp. TaxID=2093942 RepID=UPI00286EA9E4|nr:hypothetical protein [Sphaerotilus sp.]